jgi:hypothetical protein
MVVGGGQERAEPVVEQRSGASAVGKHQPIGIKHRLGGQRPVLTGLLGDSEGGGCRVRVEVEDGGGA